MQFLRVIFNALPFDNDIFTYYKVSEAAYASTFHANEFAYALIRKCWTWAKGMAIHR